MSRATRYLPSKNPLARSLSALDIPSAGPHPNITGMRRLYYGLDARLVMCGPYLYNLERAFRSHDTAVREMAERIWTAASTK